MAATHTKRSKQLTAAHKKLVGEIDYLIDRFGLDHKSVERYERAAIGPMLKSMKDHYIRGQIISDHAFIDELLGSIICKCFFDPAKSFIKLWRTKKFKMFNYFVLEKMGFRQKVDLVENLANIRSDVTSKLNRLNTLRNAYAHAFFPENLRGKKRHLYNGKSMSSREGIDEYIQDRDDVVKYLFKKVHRIDISGIDFLDE